MLEVEGLTTAYGGVIAVSDVSMKVARGQFVTIIGANGAGKTTLVGTIAGLLRAARGRVSLDGSDITNRPAYVNARAGVILVPEGRRILGPLTVDENLRLGALAARGRRAELAGDLDRVYQLFPALRERRHDAAGRLSGGQQQMLAVGRALMGHPRLLLLDEPSLGLAPVIVAQIFEAFRRLHGDGLSVLLIEQSAHRALEIANYGYVMERGRLVREGTSDELRRDDAIISYYLGQEANSPAA